jgi:hypothetical protein
VADHHDDVKREHRPTTRGGDHGYAPVITRTCGFERWARITDLLTHAQESGVFGFDHMRIGVLHLAGERGFVNAHRITLRAPGQPTVCSDELDTIELLTDHLSGADAAVHLLGQTARIADVLQQQLALHQGREASPATTVDTPARPRGSSNAFRPLATEASIQSWFDPPTLHAAPGRKRA